MNPEEYQENDANSTFEDISALKELIAVIVDYYCFKNDRIDNADQEEDDEWKKHLSNSKNTPEPIIPEEIDYLIEESFKTQLKRFSS